MKKILHCADLHLSDTPGEREYALSVLDEIVSAARKHNARFLLFAGDTFNSFPEMESVRAEFRRRMASLGNDCEVFLLAGNHEELGRNRRSLAGYDLGIPPENILQAGGETPPFSIIMREDVEFLAIPHRDNYRDYTDWQVPERKASRRIALAHGIVAGMSYTGQDEEGDEKAAVMDPDMFHRFDVSYAALGHIHSSRCERVEKTVMNYPGSARVWRKNETGPRTAALLDTEATPDVQTIILQTAGRFRSLDVFVNFESEVDHLPVDLSGWGENDYLFLRFFGVVENEGDAVRNIEIKIRDLSKKFRRVEFETGLSVLEGISGQPIALKFLETWKTMEPAGKGEDEYRAWRRARELGLLRIKNIMEARS